MKNFSLLYQYEIKKLLKLKIFPVGFSIILAVVLAMNLLTLINYSIGHNGAAVYKLSDKMELEKDYSRMLTGIDLYYVDEKGDLITEKVGPFKYIRKQREFAQKWSGKPLDDETITAMQNCIDKYNLIDEETEYNYGYTIQNYKWVFHSINKTGLNPLYDKRTAESIKDYMEEESSTLVSYEQLNEEEIAYWESHYHIDYPLQLAYTCAYEDIISSVQLINWLLIFFTIIVLCGVFAEDRTRRLRSLIIATEKGRNTGILAKLLAAISVSGMSAFFMYALTALFQFSILGTDGFHTPIQQLNGMIWTRLPITAGQAVMIVCGTGILLVCMVGAVTVLLSELFQNTKAAMAIPFAFICYTLINNHSIFDGNRKLAQLWQFFPLQRISPVMLYDLRLVKIGNHLIESIPFSIIVYLLISVVSLILCGMIAYIRRRDRS